MRCAQFTVTLCLLLAVGCARDTFDEAAYIISVDTWHAEREAKLRSETGWLTLVGLHRLDVGEQSLGSDPAADVRLCVKAPPQLGRLIVADAGLTFAAAPGQEVLLADTEPPVRVAEIALNSDREAEPTRLQSGSLVFFVIERGGELYLRVKDRESELLAGFTGIERYPVEPRWRVVARLEGPATTVKVPNVLGQETTEPSPGRLSFNLDGRRYRLQPTGDPTRGLFIVFGDATNGHGTYPGGRFLGTGPVGALGTVVLDFNRATNPPCVFTPYATCPLPAPGNVLPMPVTAGEKIWGTDH